MRKTPTPRHPHGLRRIAAAAILIAAFTPVSSPCLAAKTVDEDPVSSTVEFDVALMSRYVWRGMLLTDGPVIQPAVDVSHKGFVVNVWGNLDLDDVNGNEREFNEIDITLAYGGDVGPVSITGGLIHYTFPSTLLIDTTELFVSATADVLLQPTLSGYVDLDAAASGSYWELEGSHGFAISGESSKVQWSIDLSLGLGFGSSEYNDLYFGVAQSGLVDVLGTASAPIELGRGWALAPSIAYSSIIDGALREGVEQPDIFFGGVSAVYGF